MSSSATRTFVHPSRIALVPRVSMENALPGIHLPAWMAGLGLCVTHATSPSGRVCCARSPSAREGVVRVSAPPPMSVHAPKAGRGQLAVCARLDSQALLVMSSLVTIAAKAIVLLPAVVFVMKTLLTHLFPHTNSGFKTALCRCVCWIGFGEFVQRLAAHTNVCVPTVGLDRRVALQIVKLHAMQVNTVIARGRRVFVTKAGVVVAATSRCVPAAAVIVVCARLQRFVPVSIRLRKSPALYLVSRRAVFLLLKLYHHIARPGFSSTVTAMHPQRHALQTLLRIPVTLNRCSFPFA